jgi:predicted RNA-binding protein YlxR (DUF448 family)
MIRLVRGADGTLGEWSGVGRSAYVCPVESCIDAAMKKGRLEHVLKGKVAELSRAALRTDLLCKLR